MAVAFDILLARRVEAIDPKAVLFVVDYFEEPGSKAFELRFVHPALEDRVLDALAKVFAGRGNLMESAPTFPGLRIDVVGNQDIHVYLGVKGA